MEMIGDDEGLKRKKRKKKGGNENTKLGPLDGFFFFLSFLLFISFYFFTFCSSYRFVNSWL